jgi:hypothetical protein
MPSTTIKDIGDLIVTKVQAIRVGGKEIFGEVVGNADGDIKSYPAVRVIPKGGRGSELDTHRNSRTFNFEIQLYQEQSVAGEDKAGAAVLMTQAADAILIAFDQDNDLSGEVEIVRVVEFDTDFKVAAGTFNFAIFRIDCVVNVPNYSATP